MNQQKQKNDTSTEELGVYSDFEQKVFREVGGKIFIGQFEVTDQIRGILRDQAENFLTTQLWEILHASIVNEAYELALKQSGKSGDIVKDVQFAKALHHWAHFMRNVIVKLAK